MTGQPIAVSVAVAADLLELDKAMIYAAVNRGDLPAKRMPGKNAGTPGKSIRISVTDLNAWFDSLDDVRESA